MKSWSRPIFGPFRRKAHTGVPADRFPAAREMRFGDGETVLVADGVATTIDPLWFPTSGDLEAWAAEVGEWLGDCFFNKPEDWERWSAAIASHSGSFEKIEGGVAAMAARPPELASSSEEDEGMALHDAHTGTHSHEHSHGDGTKHSHGHFHNDSNVHNHSHAAAVARVGETERRRLDPDNEITDPEQLASLVASTFERLGGADALEAKRAAQGLTAATAPDGTVTPASWHAYLCAEGIRTDDGRELMPGACRVPDLPVSLRLLVEDEGGHWGAVTCGRIDKMDRRELGSFQVVYSEGVFGSDENGQLAELMVEEQTQRFVSIDPRDVTAEWIEVRIDISRGYDIDDDGAMYDCWMRITDCVIGAATIVAMPAFPQAVITLEGVALPDAPNANAAAPVSLPDVGEEGEAASAVAASGAPAETPLPRPPRDWFEDPGFHVGDPRLVLQEDGRSYACPVTIDPPDPAHGGLRRVYGHVAWWNCRHTALGIKPPRSQHGYVHYNTGEGVQLEDGSFLPGVGNVTQGCGHAPTFKQVGDRKVVVPAEEAIAHYDGGYGAFQVFTGRAGEDDFGPWFAGYVRPEVTEAQLAEAQTLNMSGDWRDRGGSLELCAVLMVPVPGFPVKRALTASGSPELEVFDTRAAMVGDRTLALVASGVVRRVPAESRIAMLEQRVSELASLVEKQQQITRPLFVEQMRVRAGQ